jgi:tetratricopeptide (TPR) repeat protein
MILHRLALAVLLSVAAASCSYAEDPAKDKKKHETELAKIDAQLKKTPDDPLAHYRRAQTLMKLERFDDGYAAAQKAMECLIKKQDDLAWLLLESIDLGAFRVDVRYNMGPRERKFPEMGIVRPLSFQVWKKADKAVKDSKDELVEVIDFELGVMEGKPDTAAIGITEGRSHKNLGMLEVGMAYKDIREKAVELIKQRHTAEAPKDEPKK